MSERACLVDAVRTPRARKKGKFASIHAVDLLTYPLKALVARSRLNPAQIEDVRVGCVTQVSDQGWCVARQAVLACGWPVEVPAMTINRLCASSLEAAHSAAAAIMAGHATIIIASGVEHMTRVPMFSDTGQEQSRLLAELYPDLVNQGLAAELLCEKYKLSRSDLDCFALSSHQKALKAQTAGCFDKSLIPVPYTGQDGASALCLKDDAVRSDTSLEALAALRPAFKEGGLITAGNSSSIVDGAAALLITSYSKAKSLGLKPRAYFRSIAAVGCDPKLMLEGTIASSRKALAEAKLSAQDIELWEINEAFAPVPLFTAQALGLNLERINVNGGAIALGHPLGASGAMLLNTLVDELELQDKQFGAVSMCVGLGMGVTTVIERASV